MQSCFFLMAWHYSKVTSEMEQWLCVCVLTRLEIKDEDRHASCARRKRTFLRAFPEMRNIEKNWEKCLREWGVFRKKKVFFFSGDFLWGQGKNWTKGEVISVGLLDFLTSRGQSQWIFHTMYVPLAQPRRWSCDIHALPDQSGGFEAPLCSSNSSIDLDCLLCVTHLEITNKLWIYRHFKCC